MTSIPSHSPAMVSPVDSTLDPSLRSLLDRLRGRVHRYIVWDSVLAIAAVVLGGFWIALAVDYLPVRIGGAEMPRSARGVLLLVLAVVIAAIVAIGLIGRLRRTLPDDSLALLIERQHPKLGGRLVTAVQLTTRDRRGDSHSPALLRRVHREAAAAVGDVEMGRVFRWEPIRKKIAVVVPLLLAAIALAVTSPSTFGLAVSRLSLLSDQPWPRQADLEIVGVESPIVAASESDAGRTELLQFDDRNVLRLARGGSSTLRVRAADESLGHVVPEVVTASYFDDSGNRGQSNLRRVGRVEDGYQSFVLDGPPLASLVESVTLTIAGLDDRLRGYRIEAVDPPAISELKMNVRYPNYLRIFQGETIGSGFDQSLDYQAGVRVREGSDLILRGRSSTPLAALDVSISSGQSGGSDAETTVEATLDEDRLGFSITLDDTRQPVGIRMVPRDADGISAQSPYRYFVGVVRDEPPQTTLRLKGIGSSITAIAKLPIEATATDDYGVESLVIDLQATTPSAEVPSAEVPSAEAPSADDLAYAITPAIDRDGAAPATIDLRDLADAGTLGPLPAESVVELTASARDRFDLGPPHLVVGERIRLKVVTPEVLLATLERRELEFRSRLEQSIDETQRLRQSLNNWKIEGVELLGQAASTNPTDAPRPADATDETPEDVTPEDVTPGVDPLARARARLRLRIRQSELQVAKTTEELAGIVAGLDDMLLEMLNNRVDSIDRRERLSLGVRDPLKAVVTEPLPRLRRQITELERKVLPEDSLENPGQTAQNLGTAADQAIQSTDDVLLALGAVLEKMLDLESFNEILDMVRGLIDDQEKLSDETSKEQQKRVLDLFK